jgi:hypothetical protein
MYTIEACPCSQSKNREEGRLCGKSQVLLQLPQRTPACPPALVAVDFYCVAARIRLNHIPPFGLVKRHEHLNFFNNKSMTALLERIGFEVVDSKIECVAKYPARVESLSILARLR